MLRLRTYVVGNAVACDSGRGRRDEGCWSCNWESRTGLHAAAEDLLSPLKEGARIERSCSAGQWPARRGLVAAEGGSGRRGPRDRTVPAEPWRSVERRLQQQLASILPVRSAWSKGFPLSKRRRAAQKVGAVSILWKNNPEVARAARAVWVMRCQLCWIRGAYTGWVATGLRGR